MTNSFFKKFFELINFIRLSLKKKAKKTIRLTKEANKTKKGLQNFRHMEMTYCQKPKQYNQMKQIGFKKSQSTKK